MLKKLILDLDSSERPVHGQQEGSAYNGHFGCDCCHHLFCFNHDGDLEGCMLREGHVHSAHNWRTFLEPIVTRYRDRSVRRFFRADAAFGRPDVYEFLEQERGPGGDAVRSSGDTMDAETVSPSLARHVPAFSLRVTVTSAIVVFDSRAADR